MAAEKLYAENGFHYHHKCFVDTAICPFLNATGVSIATGAGTQDVTQVVILYLPYFSFYNYPTLLLPCFLFFSLFLLSVHYSDLPHRTFNLVYISVSIAHLWQHTFAAHGALGVVKWYFTTSRSQSCAGEWTIKIPSFEEIVVWNHRNILGRARARRARGKPRA